MYFGLKRAISSWSIFFLFSAAAVKAVQLLNLHMLEPFVNYMTILTASMETSVE